MTPQRPKPRVTARRSLHAHRLEGWNRTVFTNKGENLIFMIALTPVSLFVGVLGIHFEINKGGCI